MVYYLIVCRSLTYAQRTAVALERSGITARIMRSPVDVAGEGCSHSVKVAEHSLPAALSVLGQVGLSPRRVFRQAGDGVYREVAL